ncbi:MAG: hypothetical protein RBR82_16390, partial [Pseudomonas sp.]|nr:hypothetical protein [Pseudomonas sp.]
SVVNFHDDSPNNVVNASQVGNHAIDFTTFLNNEIDPSATPNHHSATPVNVTLNNTHTSLAGSVAGTSTALANSVNMLNFDGTVANTVSFGNLTAADLVTALNNAPAVGIPVVGGIVNSTLNAATSTTNLIGNVQKHIVMVQNNQNPGEYKVFNLTSTVVAGTTSGKFDATNAELLGTLDFGNSINFGLVGNDAWEAAYAELLSVADGNEPVDPDPVDPVFNLTIDADSVDEGATATFTITTVNDVDSAGEKVAWSIGGEDITESDVDGPMSGVATIGADGTAEINVTLAEDKLTEGPETLVVTLDGKGVSDSVLVNDTSVTEGDTVAQNIANNVTYDASTGSFNFILDFDTSDVVTKVSTINGFGDDDTLTIKNAPAGTETLIEAMAAISEDLFYFREGVSGTDSWGLNFGDQGAALIDDLEGAADLAAQLEVLGTAFGEDWLTIA